MTERVERVQEESDLTDLLCGESKPNGATHIDNGVSNNKWLRINDFVHDYWCEHQKRWITFEGGNNDIRDHWVSVDLYT